MGAMSSTYFVSLAIATPVIGLCRSCIGQDRSPSVANFRKWQLSHSANECSVTYIGSPISFHCGDDLHILVQETAR